MHLRPERYSFRKWEKFDQSSNRAEFMRQECVSETGGAFVIHGAHRFLRASQIGHHRHDRSYLDSAVLHGEHRLERELVSAKSSTGKIQVICL